MDSNTQQKGRGQNKCFWTPEEDKALVDALVDLSINPMWRAENGFRGVFLLQLERMIKAKIPQTQQKATPNIESRVKHLRQKTNAIGDMLRLSGFDWNYVDSTIMCEKSAYDEYVKTHKEAAGLYGKSWPFYNHLAQVFTKDRALGNNRGDIGDDATQIEQDNNVAMEEDAGLSQTPVEDFFLSTQEPTNESPSPMPSDSSASKTSVRRKRKGYDKDPMMEQMSTNFRSFVDMVGPKFKTLATAASRNAEPVARNAEIATRNDAACAEVEEKKRLLGQVLFAVEGLTDDEAIFLLQVLANAEDQLKVFWDLPNDRKLRFCQVLLRRMSYCPPSD